MKSIFEDKFMELQSGLIMLCLEVTDKKVDKVYGYAYIDETSTMFNAFFEVAGEIRTLNQLPVDRNTMFEFLKLGTDDLSQVRELCREYGMKCPVEMKMYYNVTSGKYSADYRYEEASEEVTDMSPGEMFMEWMKDIKRQSESR